jgi:hypothetical protein
LLLLPEEQKTAIVVATLVTAWHHSTRMLMSYVYERIWFPIYSGKEKDHAGIRNAVIPAKERFVWKGGILSH